MKQLQLFLSVVFFILMFVPAHAQKGEKAADVGIDTKFYYRISSVSESTPNDPRHLTVFGSDQKLILAQTIQTPGQLWKIEDVTIKSGSHIQGYPLVRFTNRLAKDKSLDISAKGKQLRLALTRTIKDESVKDTTGLFPLMLGQSWAVLPSPEPGEKGVFYLTNVEGTMLGATRHEDVDQRLIINIAPGTDPKPYAWVLSKTDVPIDEEFELTSTSFVDGAKIPAKYTQDEARGGANVSPPLAWKGAPAGTKSFMIICTDPDAPSPANPDPNPFIHWIILNIPADTKYLTSGVPRLEQVSTPFGAVQGPNGFGEIGYAGPMPPAGSGKHRYIFTILAMDRVHVIDPNLSSEEFLKILDSSVLAKAELIGTYEVPALSFQNSRLMFRSSKPLTIFEMVLRAAQSTTVSGLRH